MLYSNYKLKSIMIFYKELCQMDLSLKQQKKLR